MSTTFSSLRTGRIPRILAPMALVLALTATPSPPAVLAAPVAPGTAPGPDISPQPLDLDEARTLALANDERIQLVAASVAAARADARGARADALPHLDLGGTWTRNLIKPAFFLPPDLAGGLGGATQVEMGGDWDLQAAATATLNLWTAGRLSAAAGAADAALDATRWQQAAAQDGVLYAVDEAYYGVLRADAQVAIAEAALAAASEALRVTRASLDQGSASRFDQLRAEVEVANRQTPLIAARNQRQLAATALARICGLPLDRPLALTDSLGTVAAPAPLDTLLADMHARSPELRALEHAVGARRQAVRLAKAGRGPILQLQGRYALQGQWDDDLLPGDHETAGSASAALAVTIPVFDGYAAKADIGRGEAELRRAQVELARVTRDRELGVRQARTYLENALAALGGRLESVTLADESHRLALVRLENGLATPLERLDAEMALTDARTQLAEVLYTCNVARSALVLAVGTHAAPAAGQLEVSR